MSLLIENVYNILFENEERTTDKSDYLIQESIDDLIVRYVHESRNLSNSELRILASVASSIQLANPPSALFRILASDPGWRPGDTINLSTVVSFSKEDLRSKVAGHIAWKSRDHGIAIINYPTLSIAIEYDKLKDVGRRFDAAAEKEVLVGGKLRITGVEKIPEPYTNPSYGYTVPLYTLSQEI
jgi:hypothetical protein